MKITAEIMNKNLDEIPTSVSDELLKIGIPTNIMGFHFLATSITLVAKDPTKATNFVKGVYTEVADRYDTTYSRVERDIRHAIGVAFDRGDSNYLYSLFGNTIVKTKGKATNSEFISLLAFRLRKDILKVK